MAIVSVGIDVGNMLTKSCIRLIRLSFERIEGVQIKNIVLGSIELEFDDEKVSQSDLELLIEDLGFRVLKDQDLVLTDKVKRAAVELIHFSYNANSLLRNSDYISERVQLPYERLSKIFSRVTGTTLEKYIILLKIEKIKELILTNEFTLSEISYKMGYNSVHYLSNQFRKVTGMSVMEYKRNPDGLRIPLDGIAN
jgi:AraC family transcriptional regulator